jgi:tRNA G18 (ribose-2'-O)-methylase SpoU
MLAPILIQDLELPALAPYRTMRRQQQHRADGIFVAEGEKVVRRLLESDLEVTSVLLPEKWFLELQPLLQARGDRVEIYLAEKKLLETLTGFSMYQGLLAVGKVPRQRSIQELIQLSAPPFLLVAADSLSSAQNVGVLVRNCAAFAAHGLIVSESCSSPFLRRAVRSSMGAIFHLPIIETKHLADAMRQLRGAGVKCVAAHPHAEGRTLPQSDLTRNSCVVFGSEGYGISSDVLAECEESIAIPMPPTVDSLNVGSAAAVFLYEAWRQRTGKPG